MRGVRRGSRVASGVRADMGAIAHTVVGGGVAHTANGRACVACVVRCLARALRVCACGGRAAAPERAATRRTLEVERFERRVVLERRGHHLDALVPDAFAWRAGVRGVGGSGSRAASGAMMSVGRWRTWHAGARGACGELARARIACACGVLACRGCRGECSEVGLLAGQRPSERRRGAPMRSSSVAPLRSFSIAAST